MVQTIAALLAHVVSIYSTICFIYIIMTWIPGLRYTAFGKFIASITEPYLGLFSKWKWTRIGNVDFSPIISIGLLSLLSSIFSRISAAQSISMGVILATLVNMLWSLISTIGFIMFLLVLIRWIALLAAHGKISYNSGWAQIDQVLGKFCWKISRVFTKKTLEYKTSLLISWIVILVVLAAGYFVNGILTGLCLRLPF